MEEENKSTETGKERKKIRLLSRKEDGSINWVKTLIGNWSSFAWFLIILFLAWSYNHDTQQSRLVMAHLPAICDQYQLLKQDKAAPCLPELEQIGFCRHYGGLGNTKTNDTINSEWIKSLNLTK